MIERWGNGLLVQHLRINFLVFILNLSVASLDTTGRTDDHVKVSCLDRVMEFYDLAVKRISFLQADSPFVPVA